jgi:hypothetical protein
MSRPPAVDESARRAPAVELLFWEGCPSLPEALADLERILCEESIGTSVELVEVTSDEQAQRERFPGSPTIRIDGDDVVPPADTEPFSLTCRVYRTRDGRISAVPDPEDVRDAVRRAA